MNAYRWCFSKVLLVFFVILYLMASIIIIMLPIHVFFRIFLLLIFSLYASYVLLMHVLFWFANAYVSLGFSDSGWFVLKRNGVRLDIELVASSCVVWPALVVICFKQPDKWFLSTICLPYDSLASTDFRRLKVNLRFRTIDYS